LSRLSTCFIVVLCLQACMQQSFTTVRDKQKNLLTTTLRPPSILRCAVSGTQDDMEEGPQMAAPPNDRIPFAGFCTRVTVVPLCFITSSGIRLFGG
ncbi:MAG TPA: hypothetical protein PKL48_09320, partial [Thermodesulfobacteriota bacterium]|nr:hypothetical protein [Thermodesulfobacteriota bacterium]